MASKPLQNVAQQDSPATAKHKRILCFDYPVDIQLQTATAAVAAAPTLHPALKNSSSSRPAKQIQTDNKSAVVRTRPNILGGNRPKRRVQTVRCSASPQTNIASTKEVSRVSTLTQQQQQRDGVDAVEKNAQKKEPSGTSDVSEGGPVSEETAPDKCGDAEDSDGAAWQAGKKEKGDERKEQSAKPHEGQAEKRSPVTQDGLNVTANKENEIAQEPQLSTPASDQSSTQATSTPLAKPSKPPSKTSSLAKQAAEMLNDIQALNSPSPRRTPASEASPTVRSQEMAASATADGLRTPSRHRRAKDSGGEGTPRRLLPPNTPDVPTCSPASEAGSENSINMAAQTLMILSRAAIARTGTPLKDSLRQEGAEKKLSPGVKVSKKRKLSSPTAVSPAKKERVSAIMQTLSLKLFLLVLHHHMCKAHSKDSRSPQTLHL